MEIASKGKHIGKCTESYRDNIKNVYEKQVVVKIQIYKKVSGKHLLRVTSPWMTRGHCYCNKPTEKIITECMTIEKKHFSLNKQFIV